MGAQSEMIVRAKLASARNRAANQCTKESPMLESRDHMGQVWYHHGSAPIPGEPEIKGLGDSQVWRCPNCGHEFLVTCRRA